MIADTGRRRDKASAVVNPVKKAMSPSGARESRGLVARPAQCVNGATTVVPTLRNVNQFVANDRVDLFDSAA
jgi:hypothetical protein